MSDAAMTGEQGQAKHGLSRRLGFWALTMFGIVAIAPIATFTIFGFVFDLAERAVVPAFAIGAIALVITAMSYGEMAQVQPSAGSSFAYARLALGELAGFLTGWAVLLDYLVAGALVALYASIFLNAALPAVPTPAWLALFLAIALSTNLLGIRWSIAVDISIAGLQFVFLAVFAGLAIVIIGGGAVPIAPAWPAGVPVASVLAGSSLAVIGYLGFDAIFNLTEEVAGREPGRTAARAAIAAMLVMMLIFIAAAWLLSSLATGMDFPDPSQTTFAITARWMPALVLPLSLTVALGLGIGGTISLTAAVSRLLFGMARDGQLPAGLARVHSRWQTPWVATLATVAIITVIAALALNALDLLTALISFGALAAFIMVNLSVLAYHGVQRHSRRWLHHWLLPAIGVLLVGYVLVSIQQPALETGVIWLILGAGVFAGRRMLLGAGRSAQRRARDRLG